MDISICKSLEHGKHYALEIWDRHGAEGELPRQDRTCEWMLCVRGRSGSLLK
jgi:hypothetical protein